MVVQTFFTVTITMNHYGNQIAMRLILLLATLMTVLPAQALFNAGVNRTIIAEHETFELTLRSDTHTNDAPDLTPLKQDFKVMGTRHSRQERLINGKFESWLDWTITLLPKNTGDLTVPSLRLGSERSHPINISVRSDLNNNGGSTGKPVMIQTDINSEAVYVQQEILFTMKILYRVPLYEDSRLTPLSIDNAIVQQLGETEKFDTIVNGTRYNVFQLQFSIHPQQEGTLEIPSLTFSGQVANNNDPFGSIFSSGGKPIVARSQPVTIEVKPHPADYPQQNWLPARDLRLQETWSQPLDSLQAGDAITRTITIEADGLSAAQLPPVFLAQPEGVNSYPDKSGSKDLQTTEGIRGQRTDAIAMIPTRAGKIKLPAVKYTWFDTITRETRVAEIPERIINVAPGAEPETQPIVTQEKQEPLECPTPEIHEQTPSENTSGLWRNISLILALLWLATGLFWWFTRHKHSNTQSESVPLPKTTSTEREKAAFSDLKAACQSEDLHGIRFNLKEWSLAYLNDSTLVSMDQCLERFESRTLNELCALLDNKLYSGSDKPIDLDNLLEVCSKLRKEKTKDSSKDSDLNDIYPE
ncbi:hypothetical protein ACH42_14550 [Endozoicomonas sp. (ex Bugula neritina AB1)]|nr:hypothetical protein ACH42_14550 [Endozoicomonas sp. (ex Bugula neritina AB1)]